MKKLVPIFLIATGFLFSCGTKTDETSQSNSEAAPLEGGQSTVDDPDSTPDIVKVASGSADHSTLVAALKAAEYVDVLANAGPFTVFAPTNAAFEQLPPGTVEDLLKPENKDALRNILEYHVFVGVINENMMLEGRVLNQVNLDDVTVHNQDGKLSVNDANVLGIIKTSNGVIYSIDKVLLPPEKK